jgi:hypothetical protein
MSSTAPFLLPKTNSVVVRVGALDDVVGGGVVAAAEGAGLEHRRWRARQGHQGRHDEHGQSVSQATKIRAAQEKRQHPAPSDCAL